MQYNIHQQILGAILSVLRPITRALLRAGIGYREFTEIAKTAFVETATSDYGLRGRPTNISRVAVMTGLTRKEVRRIRDKTAASEQCVVLKTTPVSQILHRWYTDDQYLTKSGTPKELAFDGDGVTFTSLVRKHGGDVPPGAMRTELKRIEALEVAEGGKLRPVKRAAYNVELHDRLIGGLAAIVYPAALNLAHNLETEDESSRWSNFSATTKFVRKNDRGRIMRISSDRIDEFVQAIDDMYGAYETLYDEESSDHPHKVVGVSVFYFEGDDSDLSLP